MTRISLLLPLVFALSYDPSAARIRSGLGGTWLFLSLLILLPLLGRLLTHLLLRRASDLNLHPTVTRITRLLEAARIATLLWTVAGLYYLGWGETVQSRLLGPIHLAGADLAVSLLITLPVYLAWLGLYWAQYPAERASREQAIVQHIDANLPVHSPPSLRQYLEHHVRTGPGTMILPALAVLLLRDLQFYAIRASGLHPPEWLQALLYFSATLVVYALSPLLLERILRTRPLPPGHLRLRLELLAARSNVRVSKLLIWQTGNSSGNAMVTGILPPLRYVLISDLLLETLPDEQIEAVFAHELGHIVHRHMPWYVTTLISLSLLSGWLTSLQDFLVHRLGFSLGGEISTSTLSLALTYYAFTWLSRRFERQADVYAARSMQSHPEMRATAFSPEPLISLSGITSEEVPPAPAPLPLATPPLKSPVGVRGALVFTEALERVAWINNLPLSAGSFTHGSFYDRITAIHRLAKTPGLTSRFDSAMLTLRIGLIALVVASALTIFTIGVH